MIDLTFVESLIRALDESSLDSLELERGGTRVRLSKSPPASHPLAPAQQQFSATTGMPVAPGTEPTMPAVESVEGIVDGADAGAMQEGLLEVTSPMVGTFYTAPSPDAEPYVEVGQRVGNGTVLCIIEAMKLMNELESEVEGTVAKIMVENAQPVEYGQVLFLIDPS
ncbi:MAG: acetyl-CoA carboxylase biotin carboxyl carrier protein [Gemmatimonadetes bacterium]|nr:acetyl-CoA carboxylase biotin carboxyl carrier protein [Gemmatimonadota bacterium]